MKLERLISMIYMLLNNEVLSASALAEKYNVSQRTIYRDIDVICAAGIPVVSHQGVHGGYGIIEEYKMDRSLLGSYDVGSLITVLHSMSTVFEDERAMETIQKLQTIQPDDTPSVSMDMAGWRPYNESLRLLRAGIQQRRVVAFEYVSKKNERLNRSIEPVRLMYKYAAWYVYGFCRTRKDYREFRISRMDNLDLTEERFHRNHTVERDERARDSYWNAEPEKVVLHVAPNALAMAMDQFYDADKSYNEDGSLTLTLHVPHPARAAWLKSVLLSLGEGVEVVEPAELRTAMKEKLEKMLRRYAEV